MNFCKAEMTPTEYTTHVLCVEELWGEGNMFCVGPKLGLVLKQLVGREESETAAGASRL